MSRLIALLGSTLLALQAAAGPIPSSQIIPRAAAKIESFSALSTVDIASFRPFSFFAATAYCLPEDILDWSCGVNCDANPNFHPVAAGGNGVDVQFWYVGFDPELETVIVGHQGTDPDKIIPLLTDVDFFLVKPNATLFPGLPEDIEVHNGFANEQELTADSVLAATKKALSDSGLKKVTVVGHSLGAALAVLDSVFLAMHLPKDVTLKTVGYGLPRVGNQEFADFVDKNLNLDHVNNQDDPVPTLPGRFLGFHHPQGEKRIQADESWLACPGGDNTDERCTTGAVSNILEGDLKNHDGPYDIVQMGSKTCKR